MDGRELPFRGGWGQGELPVGGQGEQVVVVADEQHYAAGGGDLADLIADRLEVASVHARAGFVEDHDAATGDADARDDQALLLSAGQ